MAWFDSVRADELYLSVIVVGEIRHGIERLARRDPARAGVFEKWLIDLQELYGNRVVPVTAAIAEAWGRLNAGDPLPVADGLMRPRLSCTDGPSSPATPLTSFRPVFG